MRSSPSKFGKGIGLLWRGMSINVVSRFLIDFIKGASFKKTEPNDSYWLFESSRSALFNCLASLNIHKGDEVIVSAFTCDAVTYAVMRTGATVVYCDINDDLTMNSNSVFGAISNSTKVIIMQNTLGRIGLAASAIKSIREKNIILIEDCALSHGSSFEGGKLGTFGDFSFFSLEVSKTLTIGWGGVLLVNNQDYMEGIYERYCNIGSVPLMLDIRRFFQLYLSLFLIKLKPPGGVWLWCFLYGFRIFRRSNSYNLNANVKREKMGLISQSLYMYVRKNFNHYYNITNRNYLSFSKTASKLHLDQPIIQNIDEFIVSPRFSLIIKRENIQKAIILGTSMGVEVGRWFDDVPPSWGMEYSKVFGSTNALRISGTIINLPCHWTLSEEEITRIDEFIHKVSLIE